MQKSHLIILTVVFFAACRSNEQKVPVRNDLTEYGYRGKLKSVTTVFYDSAAIVGTDRIDDESNWRTKMTIRFNNKGNIDSVMYNYRLQHSLARTVFSKTVYDYSKQQRAAFNEDDNGNITDTINFSNTSDTSYLRTEKRRGEKTIVNIHLTEDYRDKSGDIRSYNDSGKLSYGQVYENILGKDNLVIKTSMTDLITGESKVIVYDHADFDKFGNPRKSVITYLPGERPYKIAIRTFEYY